MDILGRSLFCLPHSIIFKCINQILCFLSYVLHCFLIHTYNKIKNHYPSKHPFCELPISRFILSSITFSHKILCNLTNIIAAPRMPIIFLPQSLWMFFFFFTRNFFSVYILDPLPHFIHVSAQKALTKKSHLWPLSVTVTIMPGTRHYGTTISPYSELLLFIADIMWHIYLFISARMWAPWV